MDRTKETEITLSPEMAVYLAGLMDGDGSVTIKKCGHHKTYAPQISFTSKDLWFLEEIRKKINGGKIRKQYGKYHENPLYHLYFERIRDCLLLSTELKRYSILKKRRLELMEEFCKIRLTRPVWKRLEFSDREVQIYEEMKKLNYDSKKKDWEKWR